MKRSGKFLMILGLLAALAGCAHVISYEMRQKAARDLPFPVLLGNPEKYRGEIVILGGVIIDTVNEAEGTTVVKVLETPLDYYGFPQDEEATRGRFIVRVKRYLDPEVYRQGRKITIAGEVVGQEVQPLGETQYTYPVVSGREVHLWKRVLYADGPAIYDYWYWGGYPYPFYLPMYPHYRYFPY